MAEIDADLTRQKNGYVTYAWLAAEAGDTGKPLEDVFTLPDKTVVVQGTLTEDLTMQGSMDRTTWFTLKDIQGNDIVFSAAGNAVILQNPRYIRFSIAAGTGGSADIYITAAK